MAIQYDELGNVIQGSGFDVNDSQDNQSSANKKPINAHRHNSQGSGEINKLSFTPNILDKYDAYTYHWKLFITSLENVAEGTVLDPSGQTIIAESGVSDLTIDKVEIHGIAVPSVESGTGTMTTVKFEIVEPSGAGLIDKMFYEATALGIGNWMVMPCFLQLEFRGRDPATSESVFDGAPGDLNGLRWVWPVKLTGAKINVTHVGSRYEFDSVIYDELAQSDSYFKIQHNVVLNGVKKFGEAMADLAVKLNDDQFEKLIDNYSIPDTYEIIVDPVLANIDLVNPDSKKDTKRAAGFKYVDFLDKTAQFNPGTGVDKIVDSILGSTDYFQKLLQNADTSSSEPKPASEKTPQMKKFWRIVTETRPIAFDALRQDNAVAITIYIVEYNIGMLDATAAQTGQTVDSLNSSKERMAEYIKNRIINKRYNYIFTGLNDQIITLDLNMNYSFVAALSRFGGVYYDSALPDKSISMQKYAENERQATEELRKTLQFINRADKSEADMDTKIAKTREAIAKSDIDDDLKARYNVLLDHAKPAQKTTFKNDLIANGGLTGSGGYQVIKNPYVGKSNSLSTPTNNGLKFISDVDINSSTAQAAAATAASIRKGKLRPIPFREMPSENNFTGLDPASNAGRARTSSLFSTALYSTLDASMQYIKLTIKGDPFWLFPRNINSNARELPYKSKMNPADAIAQIKNGQTQESVNILGTDNFIVIRFRTPRIYNETTGIVDPFTEVETFSGVYKVIRIISKFDMGKFVQELECILDPVINLSDFLHELDEDVKKSEYIVIPEQQFNIPENSIKTDRIMGDINTPGVVATASNTILNQGQQLVKSNIPSDINFTAKEQLLRRIL